MTRKSKAGVGGLGAIDLQMHLTGEDFAAACREPSQGIFEAFPLPRCLTHTTILRWVQRYVPEFEKRWSRSARPVGDSWRISNSVKIKGVGLPVSGCG